MPRNRLSPPAAALLAAAGLAALVLTPACSSSSSNPAPTVAVGGGKSDVSALSGKWVGEYSSEATGRAGSITFEFKSGKVGRGDVLMVPKGGFAASPAGSDPTKTMPQVLMINFVNAEGGVLTGTMDPYTDPSCSCEVQTTFVGEMHGDTIEGTFTTTPSGAAPITTGRWKITRQKS
jgi:hypothetical protein